jgi:hypothetical protein
VVSIEYGVSIKSAKFWSVFRIDRLWDNHSSSRLLSYIVTSCTSAFSGRFCSSVTLIMQPESAVFVDGGEEGLNRNTLEGLRIAIAEVFLLSMSDQLIMTRGSSFGGMASGLGRYVCHTGEVVELSHPSKLFRKWLILKDQLTMF